jgi:hypothetical protein
MGLKFYYDVHKGLPPVPALCQTNTVHSPDPFQAEQPVSSCKHNLVLTAYQLEAGLHNENNFQQNENRVKATAYARHLCECSPINCSARVTKPKVSIILTHSPFTFCPMCAPVN